MASPTKPVYIYDLPYTVRHEICQILDVSHDWKRLAAEMNISHQTIGSLNLAYLQLPVSGPTDRLLTELGQTNMKILRLFKVFHKLNMGRLTELLKGFIPADMFASIVNSTPLPQHPAESEDDNRLMTEELPPPSMDGPLHSQPPVQHKEVTQAKTGCPGNHKEPAVENTHNYYTRPQENGEDATRPIRVPLSPQENLDDRAALKQEMALLNIQHFCYEDIKRGTFGFHRERLLGSGGFGTVYKAQLKKTDFAVKKLKPRKNMAEPDKYNKFFLREILPPVRFPHRNIIQLSGYSADSPDICLVYQYMPSGSLEDRLDCKGGSMPLTWEQRLHILTGSACGIQYLHTVGEKPFIHGDIKSANILLDEHMEPKIADFGLAMEATGGAASGYTHVSRQDMNDSVYGSKEYLPQEFFRNYQFSIKTDTYSFGIVIFETCIGEKAFDPKREGGQNLKEYVTNVYESNQELKILQIRDPRAPNWPDHLWLKVMLLGRACTSRAKKDRPDMQSVFEHMNMMKGYVSPTGTPQSLYLSHYSQGQGSSLQGQPKWQGQYQGKLSEIEDEKENSCAPSLQTIKLIEGAQRHVAVSPDCHDNCDLEPSTKCKEIPDCGPLLKPGSLEDTSSDSSPFNSLDKQVAPGEGESLKPAGGPGQVEETRTKQAPSHSTDLLKCGADDPRWNAYDKSKLGEEDNQGRSDFTQGQSQNPEGKFTEPMPLKLQKAYDLRNASIESPSQAGPVDLTVVVSSDSDPTNLKTEIIEPLQQTDQLLQVKGVVTEVFDNTCNEIKEGSLADLEDDSQSHNPGDPELQGTSDRDSQCLNLEYLGQKDYPDFLNFDDAVVPDDGSLLEDIYGDDTLPAEGQPVYLPDLDIVQSSYCHTEGSQWAVSGEYKHMPHGDSSQSSPKQVSSQESMDSQICDSAQTSVTRSQVTRTNATPPIYKQALSPDNTMLNVNSCPDRQEVASFPYSSGAEGSQGNHQVAAPSSMAQMETDRCTRQLLELRQRKEELLKGEK